MMTSHTKFLIWILCAFKKNINFCSENWLHLFNSLWSSAWMRFHYMAWCWTRQAFLRQSVFQLNKILQISNFIFKIFDEFLEIRFPFFFSGSLEDSYQTSTALTTIISLMVIIVTRSDAENFNDNILEQTKNSKISDTKLGPNVFKKVPKF